MDKPNPPTLATLYALCIVFALQMAGCKESPTPKESPTSTNGMVRQELSTQHYTIRQADVLTPEEIESLPGQLEPRLTEISRLQQNAIAKVLNRDGKSDAPKEVLHALASKELGEVPVMDLTLVLIDLTLADEFCDHSEPIVRFLANYFLAKSGRLDAAERLYALIDENFELEIDARYLKTRFTAIGIDVEHDSKEGIAKYLANINREFPVFENGDSVPNIQFVDLEGRLTSLSDYQGKTVILHFWATGAFLAWKNSKS